MFDNIEDVYKRQPLSLISSGDFEKTNTVWRTNNASIVNENGNRLGRIGRGVSDGSLLQYANVKPGRKYRLTADVKVSYLSLIHI